MELSATTHSVTPPELWYTEYSLQLCLSITELVSLMVVSEILSECIVPPDDVH